MEHILKYEESLAGQKKKRNSTFAYSYCIVIVSDINVFCVSVSDCEDKGVNSGRLVACITTLYLFSKIRAQLMVKHAMTMQPYLTTKCNVSTKVLFYSFLLAKKNSLGLVPTRTDMNTHFYVVL